MLALKWDGLPNNNSAMTIIGCQSSRHSSFSSLASLDFVLASLLPTYSSIVLAGFLLVILFALSLPITWPPPGSR
jgi:hypothetical protein